jgi:flagellar biosynthesis/type III secretory pathway protein FliH
MMKFKAFTPESVRVFKLGENGIEEQGPQDLAHHVSSGADAAAEILSGQEIEKYSPQPILAEHEEPGADHYAFVKKTYGSFAATDPDRRPNSVKDSRFVLNPASRDRMAIAEEELRVINQRIAEQSAGAREIAHKEGFEAGRTEGLELGRKQALEEFAAHADEKLRQLDELIASFEGLKGAIYQANTKYLMSLVVRIGRAIALKELKTDPDYLERLIKNLIERVGVRENIRIKVSPEDAEKISGLKGGIEAHFGNLKNLQIDASAQVKSGGCLLETPWNTINALIDTQIQGIESALVDPIHPEISEELEAKSRVTEDSSTSALDQDGSDPSDQGTPPQSESA